MENKFWNINGIIKTKSGITLNEGDEVLLYNLYLVKIKSIDTKHNEAVVINSDGTTMEYGVTNLYAKNKLKNGGKVEKERKVFYSIWNNYVGKIEIGSYKVETENSDYDNVFLSLSDALKGLFDFIKEGLEYGNYSLAKEHPKSKFTIEQTDTSKKPGKYEDFYKKVVYTITAKEILDLHKINRLEDGGSISGFNYTVGGL